jgi:hypothetical protein
MFACVYSFLSVLPDMTCTRRSLSSYANKQGHSHGMTRFTRPYSMELTPQEFKRLKRSDSERMESVEIKFIDPDHPCKLKYIEFYVPKEERLLRRIEDDMRTADREEKQIRTQIAWKKTLDELALAPKKVGRDRWVFLKHYDDESTELRLNLFGIYEVAKDPQSPYTFTLKQIWNSELQKFQDYRGHDSWSKVFIHERFVKPGYGDFKDLTPDLIDEV